MNKIQKIKQLKEALKSLQKEVREEKPVKDKRLAEELFEKFKTGNYSSLTIFCKEGNFDRSVILLSDLWKKYIPGFEEVSKRGTRFNSEKAKNISEN